MREFRSIKDLRPCRLTTKDLADLVEVTRSGFPQSDRAQDVEIAVSFNEVTVKEHSVEDLLAHRGLPDMIDSFEIRVIGWSQKREIDKSVTVRFAINNGSLHIAAQDEAWALGRQTQIARFLAKKRPWYWLLHRLFPLTSWVPALLFLEAGEALVKNSNVVAFVGMSVFVVTWAIAMVRFFKGRFLPFTRVMIRDKRRPLDIQTTTLIVEALALLVAILALVLPRK